MSKYYRFEYSGGYVGTHATEIVKFPDGAEDLEVQECFDEWFAEQSREDGNYLEISMEEAEKRGIDQDFEN